MSTEGLKALVRRFLEASVADDQTAIMELLAPDFVAHIPGGPQYREGFLQHNDVFNQAFSGRRITVEDLVAEGDKVVARITWQGIHSGEFRGIPQTGRQIEIGAFIVERIQDGRSVEHWSLFDSMTMMQQLGLIPAPQPNE